MVDVSVLTPSFNYGRFIEDSLISVRDQRGRDLTFEHIVQDGLSSDETLDVLGSFDDVTWSSEADRGQSDALNKALGRASGRWIAWLNADEFYLPGGIAQLVREAERARVGVAYGDCVIIDSDARLVRLQAQHRFDTRVLREYGTYIASCSTIFRRAVLEDDPWDADVRRIMDWDLYMRLLERGVTFRHVPYPVGAFRLHPAQVTSSSWEEWKSEDAEVASRHGRPADIAERWRWYLKARRLHRLHKLLDRSYVRELRARSLRGRDMRWFRSSDGLGNSRELLERCYWDRRRLAPPT